MLVPDSVDGSLVGVGDQLERGVGSGQWEHAGVQGLLGEPAVWDAVPGDLEDCPWRHT